MEERVQQYYPADLFCSVLLHICMYPCIVRQEGIEVLVQYWQRSRGMAAVSKRLVSGVI